MKAFSRVLRPIQLIVYFNVCLFEKCGALKATEAMAPFVPPAAGTAFILTERMLPPEEISATVGKTSSVIDVEKSPLMPRRKLLDTGAIATAGGAASLSRFFLVRYPFHVGFEALGPFLTENKASTSGAVPLLSRLLPPTLAPISTAAFFLPRRLAALPSPVPATRNFPQDETSFAVNPFGSSSTALPVASEYKLQTLTDSAFLSVPHASSAPASASFAVSASPVSTSPPAPALFPPATAGFSSSAAANGSTSTPPYNAIHPPVDTSTFSVRATEGSVIDSASIPSTTAALYPASTASTAASVDTATSPITRRSPATSGIAQPATSTTSTSSSFPPTERYSLAENGIDLPSAVEPTPIFGGVVASVSQSAGQRRSAVEDRALGLADQQSFSSIADSRESAIAVAVPREGIVAGLHAADMLDTAVPADTAPSGTEELVAGTPRMQHAPVDVDPAGKADVFECCSGAWAADSALTETPAVNIGGPLFTAHEAGAQILTDNEESFLEEFAKAKEDYSAAFLSKRRGNPRKRPVRLQPTGPQYNGKVLVGSSIATAAAPVLQVDLNAAVTETLHDNHLKATITGLATAAATTTKTIVTPVAEAPSTPGAAPLAVTIGTTAPATISKRSEPHIMKKPLAARGATQAPHSRERVYTLGAQNSSSSRLSEKHVAQKIRTVEKAYIDTRSVTAKAEDYRETEGASNVAAAGYGSDVEPEGRNSNVPSKTYYTTASRAHSRTGAAEAQRSRKATSAWSSVVSPNELRLTTRAAPDAAVPQAQGDLSQHSRGGQKLVGAKEQETARRKKDEVRTFKLKAPAAGASRRHSCSLDAATQQQNTETGKRLTIFFSGGIGPAPPSPGTPSSTGAIAVLPAGRAASFTATAARPPASETGKSSTSPTLTGAIESQPTTASRMTLPGSPAVIGKARPLPVAVPSTTKKGASLGPPQEERKRPLPFPAVVAGTSSAGTGRPMTAVRDIARPEGTTRRHGLSPGIKIIRPPERNPPAVQRQLKRMAA